MPEIIQLKNGNQIRNKYNAAGQKLSSRNITVEAGVYQPLNPGDIIENPDVNENDNVTVEGMDHIGNMEYYSGRYFDRGSTTNAAATVQRTQYYPSGLPWKYNSGDNPSSQPYKYNGKEFVEMNGLDEYYYIFRNYQPSTMRFTTSDPLAELTPGISPYAYCFNNPVRFIDPLGLTGHDTTKDMYGRNKYDSFTGMYIPPMDRPGGMTNQGYGKLDFGYYQLTYAGYKASNSWSVTTPDGHTTYHFIDSEPVFNYEWIWYPHEEKMYGMPRRLNEKDLFGIGLGGGSSYFGIKGNALHNDLYWKGKTTGKIYTKNPFARTNVGWKANSFKATGKAFQGAKSLGTKFGIAGLLFTGYNIVLGDGLTTSNMLDAAFGVAGFIPGVGWMISGSYFIVNTGVLLYSGKSIGEHLDE